MQSMLRRLARAMMLVAGLGAAGGGALAQPSDWARDWPKTDFAHHSVPFDEIMSGGPPKDGIPAIDKPAFMPAHAITDLGPMEPVIAVEIAGERRGYPLRILLWHEIVNDRIGETPVTVTFCPLCNSAIVFDRRVGGRVLDFGTTGKLRNSDLVMYDRQTESWWQQFLGEAIVGSLAGTRLEMLPARVESFERFKARAPQAQVLIPSDPALRAYGTNPYAGYDQSPRPFLYRGPLSREIAPLERVVVVGQEAWALPLLKTRGTITVNDLTLRWEPGQNSALDTRSVAEGRDVGNVTVTRRTATGDEDVVYDESFAFAFHAFYPDGVIHTEGAP